jgi:solute carrier family 24 (sodium/potassium/calcium exchanger), member 6
LYGLVLILSTCLAATVLFTSTIYLVAGEVVSVLQTLGVVSKLSDAMLGFTVLAWGNSIGDLFANITLAKTGYTRMALAACFGGPMFSKG